jgi:hypothetical protein
MTVRTPNCRDIGSIELKPRVVAAGSKCKDRDEQNCLYGHVVSLSFSALIASRSADKAALMPRPQS